MSTTGLNMTNHASYFADDARSDLNQIYDRINTFVEARAFDEAFLKQLEAYINSLTVVDTPYPVDFTFDLEQIGLGEYTTPVYAPGTITTTWTGGDVPDYQPLAGRPPDIDEPTPVSGTVNTTDQSDDFSPDDIGTLSTQYLTKPDEKRYEIGATLSSTYRDFDVGTVEVGDSPEFKGVIKDPTTVTINAPGAAALPTKSKDFTLTTITDTPTAVARPIINEIGAPTLTTTQPTWTEQQPTYDFNGEPGAAPDNWIGTAPAIGTFVIPAYSGPADPVEPTMLSIPDVTIRDPALPELNLEEFPDIGTLPTLEGTVFYTDPGYADEQLDLIRANVSRVINGGLGIPDYFWEHLWDKATAQLHRQSITLERQARRAWAKLGWTMPGGVMLAGREQAAHDINEQVSAKALEVAIQRATQEREDYWKAMQEGTALQQLLTGLYNSQQERALKLAISQVEVYVNVYNAYIARYTAQVQAVQYRVAMFEMQLKAALAVLDVDKAKLEAAKLKGEVNQIAAQTYVAKWEAVKNALAKWEVAVKTVDYQVKAKELELQRYAEQTKNWMTEVEAWGKEWEGYVAKLKAQETKASTYEAAARVFSERMKGYGISVEAEKARIEASVSSENLKLEQYKTDIQRLQTDWTAINAKLANATQVYSVDAQIFGTQAELAKTASQIQIENEKLKLQAKELELQRYKAEWDGKTAKYTAEVQAFTGGVQAYAAKINAEVQALQARVTAAGLPIQAFTADVDKYKADITAALGEIDSTIKFFSAETTYQGVEGQLKGEQLRAEATVIGHHTQIEGYKAQYLGAKAQYLASLVDAQVAFYNAKVNKYAAEVQFEKVEADAYLALVESDKATYAAQIAGFQAEVQKYSALVQAEAAAIQAEGQRLQAEASAQVAAYQIGSLGSDIYTRAGQVNAQIATANAQISSSAILGIAEVKAKGYEAMAGFESQLAAGAMSAMNISASVSNSATGSIGAGYSFAEGNSYTESVQADGGDASITGRMG